MACFNLKQHFSGQLHERSDVQRMLVVDGSDSNPPYYL